ncbi:hypothetical protein MKEN_01448200 [Mycena kentingensis (nom. inval.)]|nr:hypothetical protein MKEN_01448200 [Mycena kentingensis (nom. inval.)]
MTREVYTNVAASPPPRSTDTAPIPPSLPPCSGLLSPLNTAHKPLITRELTWFVRKGGPTTLPCLKLRRHALGIPHIFNPDVVLHMRLHYLPFCACLRPPHSARTFQQPHPHSSCTIGARHIETATNHYYLPS